MFRTLQRASALETLASRCLGTLGENSQTICASLVGVRALDVLDRQLRHESDSSNSAARSKQWKLLHHQGYDINPCNSPLHPAVTVAGIKPENSEEVCVQEAYTPESVCFGCGPSAPDGLKLQSFRRGDGLEAIVKIDNKYCAFPGIINGGIISALFDCHGNWTAAVSLMDRGCLPKPPLTLTYEMLVTYEEPTPPNEDLVLRSTIVNIREGDQVGSKATVQVDLTLHQKMDKNQEKLLATGSGIFKKLGALRAL